MIESIILSSCLKKKKRIAAKSIHPRFLTWSCNINLLLRPKDFYFFVLCCISCYFNYLFSESALLIHSLPKQHFCSYLPFYLGFVTSFAVSSILTKGIYNNWRHLSISIPIRLNATCFAGTWKPGNKHFEMLTSKHITHFIFPKVCGHWKQFHSFSFRQNLKSLFIYLRFYWFCVSINAMVSSSHWIWAVN